MSARLLPPADLEAEQSFLGAMLLRPQIIHEVKGSLDPSDFYKPGHQYAYLAALQLHEAGQPVDTVTVVDALTRNGVVDSLGGDGKTGAEYLLDLSLATPSISAFARYADIVIECSRRRQMISELSGVVDGCYDRSRDVDELLGMAEGVSTNSLIAPRATDIAGLFDVASFAAQTTIEDATRPFLVPHLIKALWRLILVAPEGIGKAVLLRFIAAHAAAGRDPWHPATFIEPRRVLYVDTENPAETILHQIKIANRYPGVDLVQEGKDNFFIWHREGGMNLRDRRPQAEFESVLHKVQPEIVMAGPLYKLYRRSPREDMEMAALEFTEVLDDFRVRFKFGLMLEHHAPKATGGAFRDLNPFGSSLFMRWPEIGLTLDYDGTVEDDATNYELRIGRFRRDRVVHDWPSKIERNDRYRSAWSPYWAMGREARLRQAT